LRLFDSGMASRFKGCQMRLPKHQCRKRIARLTRATLRMELSMERLTAPQDVYGLGVPYCTNLPAACHLLAIDGKWQAKTHAGRTRAATPCQSVGRALLAGPALHWALTGGKGIGASLLMHSGKTQASLIRRNFQLPSRIGSGSHGQDVKKQARRGGLDNKDNVTAREYACL